jgi:hypothetical protein
MTFMKKYIIAVAVLACVAGIESKAQEFRPSVGLELAFPTGDFGDAYTLGYGLSLGGELPVGDNIGVTLTAGYILLSVDSELSDFIKSAGMIPVQAGVKYYISEQQEGLYIHGQIGIHSNSVTSEDIEFLGVTVEGTTESDSNLSFAIGGGYFINENIDLGLRYNIITTDVEGADASSYLGVRAAYNF